jgi:hypothetical protein
MAHNSTVDTPISAEKTGIFARLRTVLRDFASIARLDMALAMTALWFLIYNDVYTRVSTLIIITCVVGLLYKPLLKKWPYWLVMTLLLWWSMHLNDYLLRDEFQLGILWAIAILLSLATGKADRYLAINGRVLIGLIFLISVVQKLIAPDYVDSSFFETIFLLDERFSPISSFLVNSDVIAANSYAYRLITYFNNPLQTGALQSAESIRTLAFAVTWWTIFIEVVVGVLFLWPWRGRLAVNRITRWRDIPMLIFLITTYPFAHVIPFSWMLVTMGIAQSEKKWVRMAYLVVLFIGLFRISTTLGVLKSMLGFLPG